jgi:hypothetical protein
MLLRMRARENERRPRINTEGDNTPEGRRLAKGVVTYFHRRYGLDGSVMDCCAGSGVMWQYLSAAVSQERLFWCEKQLDCDFLAYNGPPVKWIIANPPFRRFLPLLEKAFQVAENVVFILPRRSGDGYHAQLDLMQRYGYGLRSVILLPRFRNGGKKNGLFASGVVIGVFHWQKGWTGTTETVDWRDARKPHH